MDGQEIKHVTLPIPISDNNRLIIHWQQRRMILSKKARDWLLEARLLLRVSWPKKLILVPSKSYQLHIKAKAYVPNWRGDCSNFTKILKDAMSGIVYDDDKFIHIDYEDSEKDAENPRIELSIPINRISLATIVRDEETEAIRPRNCTCAYPALIAMGWPESGISHHPRCERTKPESSDGK